MKIRLGILPDPIERVKKYIDDVENWKLINSNFDGIAWYYLLHPEFTIELLDEEEDKNAQPPNFSFIQMNGRSSELKVNIKYHSTILFNDLARYVDEARGIVVYPDFSALNAFKLGSKFTNAFDYYIKDSIKIQLSSFLMKINRLDREGWLWERHLSYIPVFIDKDEMNEIKSLINENSEQAIVDVTHYKKEVCISGYNSGLTDEERELVKQDLATNLMVIERIKEYRMSR